jgi:hypothetical protein
MSEIFLMVEIFLVTLVASLLWLYQRRKLDPREPPLISSTIPLVGHLISFMYYGLEYFPMIRFAEHIPFSPSKEYELTTSAVKPVFALSLWTCYTQRSTSLRLRSW